MNRIAAPLAALLFAAGAAQAAPPADPPYPTSDQPEVVIRWVGQISDLPKEDIVLIGAGGVFALSADPAHPPTADGRLLRRLREEVTDPALAEKLDGRSFSATLTIDCAHFNSSLTEAKVYRGANLKGGPARPITAAQWLSASSIYLYDLTGPICEKSGKSSAPAPAAPTPAAPMPTEAAPPASEPAALPAEAPKPAPKPVAPVKVVKPKPKPVPPPVAAPAPVAEAGVWVQAGAYASDAIARAKFEALVAAVAPAPLVGPRLEPVPGQPLVRLLIGPYPTRSLAAQTCAALKRQKTDCFVRP